MNIVKAFLAGITLGVLFAPQSGERTRKRLAELFKDYKDEAKDYVTGAVGEAESRIHKVKKSVESL